MKADSDQIQIKRCPLSIDWAILILFNSCLAFRKIYVNRPRWLTCHNILLFFADPNAKSSDSTGPPPAKKSKQETPTTEDKANKMKKVEGNAENKSKKEKRANGGKSGQREEEEDEKQSKTPEKKMITVSVILYIYIFFFLRYTQAPNYESIICHYIDLCQVVVTGNSNA